MKQRHIKNLTKLKQFNVGTYLEYTMNTHAASTSFPFLLFPEVDFAFFKAARLAPSRALSSFLCRASISSMVINNYLIVVLQASVEAEPRPCWTPLATALAQSGAPGAVAGDCFVRVALLFSMTFW